MGDVGGVKPALELWVVAEVDAGWDLRSEGSASVAEYEADLLDAGYVKDAAALDPKAVLHQQETVVLAAAGAAGSAQAAADACPHLRTRHSGAHCQSKGCPTALSVLASLAEQGLVETTHVVVQQWRLVAVEVFAAVAASQDQGVGRPLPDVAARANNVQVGDAR